MEAEAERMKIGWMGREVVEMEARPEVLLLMMKAERKGGGGALRGSMLVGGVGEGS